jgi:tRNA U34 5-carboxymethylaminomethyl modifying GTPase MnmE/TrmE
MKTTTDITAATTTNPPAPIPVADVLTQAGALLHSLGADYAGERQQLTHLADRLAQGRFHLAVLGQFKRGKSTLLNALLGEALLPSSVVPVTAIPTFVRAGDSPSARVVFGNDRSPVEFRGTGGALTEFLTQYVTESGNPKNAHGVTQVEVTHPAAILRRGVALIDTPGIGSTFQHNTEATLNFLPQCDAALFLVSADPPLTAVEAEFLRAVRAKVPRLFFVLNKADQLDAAERQTALAFLRRQLTEQAGIAAETPLFCVSARQALAARRANDAAAWTRSGLAELERHLVEFLAEEKTATLRDAVARKAADVLGEALLKLRLALRSLELPVEELQHRLAVFDQKLAEIQRERVVAGDLLAGDWKRAHEFLEQHAEQLRGQMRVYLEGVLEETLARNGSGLPREEALQETLAQAIPGYCEHHVGGTTTQLARHVADVLRPHQERADRLIESVRRTAAELFDVPYHAPESSGAFELVEQPYWVTHKWSARLIPFPPGLLESVLSPAARKRRLQTRLREQVADLVTSNVEKIRWAAYQSLDQTFRRFTGTLDERLAGTIAATHGAIRAALDKRHRHRAAVAQDIARLESAITSLQALRHRLAPRAP